jgi:hypothetical protein
MRTAAALRYRLGMERRRAPDVAILAVQGRTRNYEDICETIREFMRRGVVIRTVINGITFDGATKDAMQRAVRDALIAFMAATAQAQAEATKVHTGLRTFPTIACPPSFTCTCSTLTNCEPPFLKRRRPSTWAT